MPWLIVGLVVGALYLWDRSARAATSSLSTGSGPAANPGPAPFPIPTGPATAPMVTLMPGEMGTLPLPSFMANGNNESVAIAAPVPPYGSAALQQLITGIVSSNTSVLNPAADAAGPVPGLTIGSGLPAATFGMAVRGPGTTKLTITWQDSTGATTQTTTMTVTVPQ
jgi:hypothetical protein